jgi:hypothetical protein
MREHARVWLLTVVCGVLLAGVLLPATALAVAEVPAIEKFVATNCEEEECGEENVLGPFNEPKAEVTVEEAEEEGFTQAGGRVPFGVTDFKVLTTGNYPNKIPTSLVTHLRTDVAPGLATNPFAVTQCSLANFGNTEAVPNTGFYAAPKCTGDELGTNEATVYAGPEAGDVPLSGTVYNLEPEKGLASEFGVALELPIPLTGGALKKGFEKAEEEGAEPGVNGFPSLPVQKFLEEQQYFAHTLIKGNVEWGKQARGTNQGDYHDYFEIDVSPKLPLIRSRLVFEGQNGNGDFITNATSCPGHNTTTLKMTDLEGATVKKEFTTPIGLSGCGSLAFEPSFALTPETTASDQPDAFTAAASEPHNPKANDQSQVKSASFTLPEGMTLNPSAAHGLEACTPKQAHQEGTVFGEQFGVECPAGSKVGTVSLDVPTLPNGSLTGSVYLGGPESGPITAPPYTIYVVANSEQFGVSVRLIGEVIPNEVTGQVTTFFRSPPEQPFSKLSLQFERGVLAPVANPLLCGTPTGSSSFEPTSAPGTAKTAAFGVSVTGCAATIPFALSQSTSNQTSTAGGHTSYTFNLARPDGNQYLSEVKTVLPAGLVGEIPKVTLCTEPAAAAGTCAAASQIGTATVLAGSGSTPFSFSGPVYLTDSYKGAPYGLSIAVPAIAGPFNLGTVVTRATINVNPATAQVEADSVLPRVVKGVPLRLRNISVAVNKQGFLLNPTSCGALSTASTLTSFTTPGSTAAGATQTLTSPLQLTGCSALKFKPTFKASTSSKTSRANGASLTTTITQPSGQANIKSVKVQLPRQLPSRLSTLQKACTEAVFASNPSKCPSGSFVGGATVTTPTLPEKLKGPAILVSHAGAAFPDLDLVLETPRHVRVILTGNTNIKNNVTTTTFASTPDVPVSSVTVSLPTGSHSALAAFGNLCAQPLVMPTTITGQNGTTTKQNTIISVGGCGVRIVGHKVVGNTAFITVQTFAAGRLSASGSGLKTVYRHLSKASKKVSLTVPLRSGTSRPRKVRLRVGFLPSAKHGKSSAAFVKLTFR